MTTDEIQRLRELALNGNGTTSPYVPLLCSELLALVDEIENGACHRHAGQRHGFEAEELRSGLELLIGEHDKSVPCSELQRLLDDVDARDSLAYLEAMDAKLAAMTAARDEACDIAADYVKHRADTLELLRSFSDVDGGVVMNSHAHNAAAHLRIAELRKVGQ